MERGWSTLIAAQENTSYHVKVVVAVEGGEGLASFSFPNLVYCQCLVLRCI